jgi:uncharacterized protein with PIN domain
VNLSEVTVAATKPFDVVERDDLNPVCPHCEAELAEVYVRKRGVPLIQGRSVLFFCPTCRKVLGIGQERVA